MPEDYEQSIARVVAPEKLLIFVQEKDFESFTNVQTDERSKVEWIKQPTTFVINTLEKLNKINQPYAEFPLSFNFYTATVNLPPEMRVSEQYEHIKKTTGTK